MTTETMGTSSRNKMKQKPNIFLGNPHPSKKKLGVNTTHPWLKTPLIRIQQGVNTTHPWLKTPLFQVDSGAPSHTLGHVITHEQREGHAA